MARGQKLTRAERRERRATLPQAGVYGVDTKDAGAGSWVGRYMLWAESSDEATARIRDAGFHRQHIRSTWRPEQTPPEGTPSELRHGNLYWYRSRLDHSGWTPWEQLPPDYRHPPQGHAAQDPSLR